MNQDFPADTMQAMALWLARHMDRVRQHEAAADIVAEVTAAVRQAARVIDRPAPRVYAGPCDCGTDLLTKPGRTLVSCPACGSTYGIAERLEWMRARLEDHLGTATYAAAILPGIGVHVTAGTIRVWASRGRLASHPGIPRTPGGVALPTYRLGDVIDLALARDTAGTRLAVTCACDLLLRKVQPYSTLAPSAGRHPHARRTPVGDVMMLNDRGVPLMCETEGCGLAATTVWHGTWHGRSIRACASHNPMANATAALPMNFTSHSLCHACGQPVHLSPQQVIYPGTAG